MKRIFEFARSTLIWMIALPVLAVFCLLIVLLSLVHRGRGLDVLMKAASRSILACCGVRVRLKGAGNVAPGTQYVLMMNHVNLLDPFVFIGHYPGLARGIEEESHFQWPFYGWMLHRIGQVPISRKDPAKARESLATAAALVRGRPDYSILILPEGTRTPDGNLGLRRVLPADGDLGPFKRGGFHLALETGLDILPVVQTGAYRILRKGSLLVRPGKVELTVLPPIPVAGCAPDAVGELADLTRSVFMAALGTPGSL
jgi:1-acyl-sn-glycerol-3-phosphate acyltransferase